MTVPYRLAQLMELANQGPAMRTALAEEIAELLVNWPADCPPDMRGPCEMLLARTAKEADAPTRARLRTRLQLDPALAMRLLPDDRIDHAIVATARRGGYVSSLLSEAFDLPAARIKSMLADSTGHSLAIACKGAGLSHATFSTLVILIGGKSDIAQMRTRLNAYDAVNVLHAVKLLRRWRDGGIGRAA